ncbi:hypothetical protein Hanom_Chr11g00968561 [Helianthus anomalus]
MFARERKRARVERENSEGGWMCLQVISAGITTDIRPMCLSDMKSRGREEGPTCLLLFCVS